MYKSVFLVPLLLAFSLDAYPVNTPKCVNNCDRYDYETLKYTRIPTPEETCKFCYAAMPLVKYLVVENKTELFPEVALVFCDIFKIIDENVCNSAVKEFEVYKIIKMTKNFFFFFYSFQF